MKKIEADSALSKAVSIVSKSSGSNSKVYQKQSGSRFFGSRTSRYGAASGKMYQPYNRYQGKGKQNPQQALLQERKCFQQTRNESIREEPTKQPTEQMKTATGREITVLCTGMGAADTGSMDPGYGSRLQNTFSQAASQHANPGLHLFRNREQSTFCRDRKVTRKASHKSNRG